MLEHRFAQLTAAATFILLLIGGTVNATGSSLACPEPTLVCHGQLFPAMTGGVLYEHGHRLVAMTVGLLQIILTVLLWRRRPALRWLGVGALVAVCLQGALGAITVAYKLPTVVSMGHLTLAMLYFALLLYLAWRTRTDVASPSEPRVDLGNARTWIAIAATAVFVQILLGGLVRHTGGTLACVDLPLCHGSLFPAGATLPLKAHMSHRVGGILVGLIVLIASFNVYRAAGAFRRLRLLALFAPAMVIAQIVLGVFTILTFRQVPVAVAHFGGAMILWGLWMTMWWMTREATPAGTGDVPPLATRAMA